MADWKTVTLKVTGEQTIHCASCENAIQRAVNQLPGIKSVKADQRTQQIQVNVNREQTTVEQLKNKLNWMGYAVQEVHDGRSN